MSSVEDFQRRLDETKISKADLNFVIMDYLINEGYPKAAEKFATEANLRSWPGDSENLNTRVQIRNAVLSGNIQSAIQLIKSSFPRVLDLNGRLLFSLLRLQLVEIIRQQNVDMWEAISFARDNLAPLAPANPDFQTEFEHTMALLIYPADKRTPVLKELLDPKLRQQVAIEANQALLEHNAYDPQPRLKTLVHIRKWAENRAVDATARGDGPKGTYLETLGLWDEEKSGGVIKNGAGEDSVMSGAGDVEAEGAGEPMAA
ncbi:MAG: hypothetical protein M1831_002716 [Alyxoria varia]|nr:MAG: hypothetical protein M1831_002716 [Alyxoria varia]